MSRTRRKNEQDEQLNVITLYRTISGWMAKFEGPSQDEVVAHFGTSIIPTAFTEQAQPAEVLATISQLNPEHIVRLAPESTGTGSNVNWAAEAF